MQSRNPLSQRQSNERQQSMQATAHHFRLAGGP
jgi:hypothetical protein